MKFYITALLSLSLTGCALFDKKHLPPPGTAQPPTVQTTGLNDAIVGLEKDLNSAQSRAEKLQILIDALY
jgi:hypothetical protein